MPAAGLQVLKLQLLQSEDGIATSVGLNNGIASITLDARHHMLTPDNTSVIDHAVVCHLRMGLEGLQMLKQAIDNILLIASQPAANTKNQDAVMEALHQGPLDAFRDRSCGGVP